MISFSNKTLNIISISKFIIIVEIIFLISGILYIVTKPQLYESKLIYSVGTFNVDFMHVNSGNLLVDIPQFILDFRQNPEVFNSACPKIEPANLSIIQSKITPSILELSVKAQDADATQICILAIKDILDKREDKSIKGFLNDNEYMIMALKASQDSMIDILKRAEFNKNSSEIIYVMEFNEMAREIARHKMYAFKAKRWGGRVIFQSTLPKYPIKNNNNLTLAIFLLSGLIVASFLRFIKTKL
jgi:hypothetical protein